MASCPKSNILVNLTWPVINLAVIPRDRKPMPSLMELHRFSTPSCAELQGLSCWPYLINKNDFSTRMTRTKPSPTSITHRLLLITVRLQFFYSKNISPYQYEIIGTKHVVLGKYCVMLPGTHIGFPGCITHVLCCLRCFMLLRTNNIKDLRQHKTRVVSCYVSRSSTMPELQLLLEGKKPA